ncbi:MAG: cupredoxin family protein [Sterolibacterium sp.]
MKQPTLAALVGLMLASGPAFAHGDEDSHGTTIGKPGAIANIASTVTVEMNDAMRFVPSSITVRHDDTIRFLVKNSGRLKHDLVLGSVTELKEHAALMRKFPSMEHADPNQVAVDPGMTRELAWQFTKAGKVDFACLQPGHDEAGMKGNVVIK